MTLSKRGSSHAPARAMLAAVLGVPLLWLSARADDVAPLLEAHAANKGRVLARLQEMPQLALTQAFGADFRAVWRRVLIDGPCNGIEKPAFLRAAMAKTKTTPVHGALEALLVSHEQLFGAGRHRDSMVRHAGDAAFRPFGRHMTLAEAMAEMTAGNGAEVQAFRTIFETGQNTRGFVHKMECHAEAVEFIYAVTDIVYGVMLPTELSFERNTVTADPRKVQMFYIKAGEVVALHPYVLHSGSLSVEPNRSFSIVIYKKPTDADDRAVELPAAWHRQENCIRIPGVDKFYLTLDELHTGDLKDNRGYITGKRPVRLPTWK